MHWIDPAHLPETRGTVTQFLLNPHGDIDGLILDGKLQVHAPPHLSKRIGKAIAPGDKIRVRGVRPRGADVIAAIQLTSKAGVAIDDDGPTHAPHPVPPKGKPSEIQGEVLRSLYGPKGELRGALLKDGTSLRVPPHAAADLREYLLPGAWVQVWGHGVKTKFGYTINVAEIAKLVDNA